MTRLHVRVESKVRGEFPFMPPFVYLTIVSTGKLTSVKDVEHGYARSTGQFNYTFSVPKDIKVMPHSYQEYMMYIDARRRVKLGDIQTRQEKTNSEEERKQLTKDANLTE